MNPETTAEQLFFVTLRIESSGVDSGWIGTGFIYGVETTKGTAHFLITNKHVLQDAESLAVTFISSDGTNAPRLGDGLRMTWKGVTAASWAAHPDPGVDVAAAALSPLLNAAERAYGRSPFIRSVSPALCLRPEQLPDLDAYESVVFVGYPAGIYDTTNLLPVMRRGTTATPIGVNYRGMPAFLIDAAVFPGSSGSPVFLMDQGSYSTRGTMHLGANRLILLGILAAAHVRQVDGRVRELPAKFGVEFDEPVGLGIVFRAEAIDVCVDQLLARGGLVRGAPESPAVAVAQSPADEALQEMAE